jgi:hypothetical protein
MAQVICAFLFDAHARQCRRGDEKVCHQKSGTSKAKNAAIKRGPTN